MPNRRGGKLPSKRERNMSNQKVRQNRQVESGTTLYLKDILANAANIHQASNGPTRTLIKRLGINAKVANVVSSRWII